MFCVVLENVLSFSPLTFSPAPTCHSSLSAGEGGEKMERGAAGATPKNDGGKAVTCRVQARAAAAGNSEEGTRRRGQGRGGNPFRKHQFYALKSLLCTRAVPFLGIQIPNQISKLLGEHTV